MGGYFVGSCGLNQTVLSLIYIFQGRGFDDKLHVPVLKLTNVSHLIKKLVVVIVNWNAPGEEEVAHASYLFIEPVYMISYSMSTGLIWSQE